MDIKSLRKISNIIAGVFFLIGALMYVINDESQYGKYMYLVCAIFFVISGLLEINFCYFCNKKITKKTNDVSVPRMEFL